MPEEQLVERGAPNWINCELCKRRGTYRQARFVIAEDETAKEEAGLVKWAMDQLVAIRINYDLLA